MNINIKKDKFPTFLYIDLDLDFISDLNIIEVYTDKRKYKVETTDEYIHIPIENASGTFFIKSISYNNDNKIEQYKFYTAKEEMRSNEDIKDCNKLRQSHNGFNSKGIKLVDFHDLLIIS